MCFLVTFVQCNAFLLNKSITVLVVPYELMLSKNTHITLCIISHKHTHTDQFCCASKALFSEACSVGFLSDV